MKLISKETVLGAIYFFFFFVILVQK